MKKKILYTVSVLFVVLILVLGLGMGMIYAENKETTEIVDLIEEGERLLMPSIYLDTISNDMDALDSSAQKVLTEVYLERLDRVYVKDSAPYRLRSSALNSFLGHDLTTREISYEFVKYEIESIDIQSDKAVVEIVFVDSIRSINKSEDGLYDTIVSQSNNKLKVNLLKEDDCWKISSCEVLDYQSIVDEELSGNKEFSNFDDAKEEAKKLDVEVDTSYLEKSDL